MAAKKRRGAHGHSRGAKGKKAGKARRAQYSASSIPSDGGSLFGTQVTEGPSWDFGRPYEYRQIAAVRAVKYYVCPGCNVDIPPGVAHIVAWPRDSGGQGDDRRHWHSRCWQQR